MTFCTKTSPDAGGDFILFRKRWETAINDATSAATLANQKLPQNQWQVHPVVRQNFAVVKFSRLMSFWARSRE